MPRQIKIIAYVYILLGVLGITEMVLQATVFHRLSIDIFSFIFVLTGMGLLRGQWRDAAIFFSWLYLIGAVILFPIAISFLCFGVPKGVYGHIGPLRGAPAAALGALLIGLFAVWQLRVLRRPDNVHKFQSSQAQIGQASSTTISKQPRWQFSLRTLMVAMTIVGFILARIFSDDVRYSISHQSMSISTLSGGLHRAEYGIGTNRFSKSSDELAYAVLVHGDDVHTQHGAWDDSTYVETPDGQSVEMPGDHQLYEVKNGQLTSIEGRVTLAEFNDFMFSDNANWNLAELIDHARKTRQDKATAESAANPK